MVEIARSFRRRSLPYTHTSNRRRTYDVFATFFNVVFTSKWRRCACRVTNHQASFIKHHSSSIIHHQQSSSSPSPSSNHHSSIIISNYSAIDHRQYSLLNLLDLHQSRYQNNGLFLVSFSVSYSSRLKVLYNLEERFSVVKWWYTSVYSGLLLIAYGGERIQV